jgi:AP endonuclease-1
MRNPHFAGIPLILETPLPEPTKGTPNAELSVCDKEIELLYRIQAIEDDEWEKQKDQIAAEWRVIRDKLNPPKEKAPGPAGKKSKGKKSKKDEEDEEDEEDE